jgi:hypothetical protein
MTEKTLNDLKGERRKEMASLKIQRFFNTVMPYMIVLLALGIIYLTTRLAATTQEVKETAAYTRVSNCIVAKVANPPTTQDDIERCYVQVEKNTGKSLERIDEQVNGEN